MTRFHRSASLVLLFGTLAACAHGRTKLATTESPLALDRVVLYRNGVGYFERRGEVDENVLRIKVRRDQVDDLLKSLTVIDRKNGQAVSISMPLDPESWANAALSTMGPGRGNLAEVLDGLRGTEVVLATKDGRKRGRIVMVEQLDREPVASRVGGDRERSLAPEVDHRVTLLNGDELVVVRLSQVKGVTLVDRDLALQLHRRLDASAGEGMFAQVEVAIRLTGRAAHELMVSYVVGAPMWKPTYRVVLPEGGQGQALLQGWAVVDNTSGEDWDDVRMSLTSGEPIAFRYDLHTPREVDRADLTESGVRKRARVAVGETTYNEAKPSDGPAPEEVLEESDADFAADETEERAAAKDDASERKRASKASRRRPASPPPPPLSDPAPSRVTAGARPNAGQEPQPSLDFDALRRSTLASARAKQVAGMTRFDLDERVTVPNGSSTMVAILNQSVQAEETFLYRPGGAGMGYEQNPYRVVRFKNDTPFVLESGPISVYTGGSFVGEGLSEAVGTKTSATIPFAVEPTILVTSVSETSGAQLRLVRIVRGVLEVESYARTVTTWTAKSQNRKQAITVFVRHPKAGWNYQIVERPPGTEDLADGYLVPLQVAAGAGEASIKVVEQTPSETSISIWDGRALELLEQLMLATDLGAARKQLEPIVALRREIGRIDTETTGLRAQKIELDQRAHETRQNLDAIKKDAAAGSLRRKLSARLEEFTGEGDRLARRIVELQSLRLEKKIALEDLLEDLDLRAPSSAPSKRGPGQ